MSSPRTRGPIRRGLAFGTMANGFCSNKRRWLWVPAFAGTTTHSGAHSYAMNRRGILRFKQPRKPRLRDLAARCVRVLQEPFAQEIEGAGNAGAQCTRSLACKCKKHTSVVTTGHRNHSGIPCARESIVAKNIDKSMKYGSCVLVCVPIRWSYKSAVQNSAMRAHFRS